MRLAPAATYPGMRVITAVLAVCATVAPAATAVAKSISIAIDQQTEMREDRLVARIKISNGGDEAARSVVVTLRFADQAVHGARHESLAAGASLEEELALSTGPLNEGRWPHSIAVDYADANLYPFQALLVNTIVIGNPPLPKVALEISADPIATSGSLAIRFKNLAATARDATYRIAVPDGLEASEPTGKVSLAPWGEATIDAGVLNRAALHGSRYPAFVVLEYDNDGAHQTVVASSTLAIVAPRSLWQRNQTMILAAALVLVAYWLWAVRK